MIKRIKVSKRTKIRFDEWELDLLRSFIDETDNPYSIIKANTGISRDTVLLALDRGWAERDTALRMRDFLNALKKMKENETSY